MFCQEDGCGLSNIMKHSLEKWPECDKILRNFLSGLERGNQALKPQGEWGGNGEDKKTRFRYTNETKPFNERGEPPSTFYYLLDI